MQGTRVLSPVLEDPTYLGATKPLQWEAWTPKLDSSPHLPQLEKAHVQQQRPNTAQNNFFFFLEKELF